MKERHPHDIEEKEARIRKLQEAVNKYRHDETNQALENFRLETPLSRLPEDRESTSSSSPSYSENSDSEENAN